MILSAIILAGGKSIRMGEDKGLVLYKNKPMIQHLLDLFKLLNISTIIIANNDEYKRFGVPVYPDVIKNKGPLGGLYAGLYHSKSEKNIVVSCDVPCLSKQLIEYLILNSCHSNATVISFNDKIQPLTAMYSKKLKNKILLNLFNSRLKMKDFLQEVGFQELIVDESNVVNVEKDLINVNTKEELKRLENGK